MSFQCYRMSIGFEHRLIYYLLMLSALPAISEIFFTWKIWGGDSGASGTEKKECKHAWVKIRADKRQRMEKYQPKLIKINLRGAARLRLWIYFRADIERRAESALINTFSCEARAPPSLAFEYVFESARVSVFFIIADNNPTAGSMRKLSSGDNNKPTEN